MGSHGNGAAFQDGKVSHCVTKNDWRYLGPAFSRDDRVSQCGVMKPLCHGGRRGEGTLLVWLATAAGTDLTGFPFFHSTYSALFGFQGNACDFCAPGRCLDDLSGSFGTFLSGSGSVA